MRSIALSIATAAMLAGSTGFALAAPGDAATTINNNQAVATNTANASMPAHGANSFTTAQAKSRIEKDGFSNVTNLSKDNTGVWHADAQKDGTPTPVWLDYRGNVGEGK